VSVHGLCFGDGDTFCVSYDVGSVRAAHLFVCTDEGSVDMGPETICP
jgi:hypothetical protein